jgi:hypothetical protein
MKQKIVLLIIALMSVAFLSSCQKQDVKTSPESVAVITKPQPAGETSAEGIRPVTIAATCSWSAVSDSDWLTVSPASGEKGMQEVILSFRQILPEHQEPERLLSLQVHIRKHLRLYRKENKSIRKQDSPIKWLKNKKNRSSNTYSESRMYPSI